MQSKFGRTLWAPAAALLAVSVLAWTWLLMGAGTGINAIDMTAMAGMDGWLMERAVWSAGYAAIMFAMWWVMMIAMMLPSAMPVLLLFARVIGDRRADAPPGLLLALFVAGYLLVWGAFSALVTGLQWTLEDADVLSPMMATTDRLIGAAILFAAGAWQLTPLKAHCLSQCRSPLGFLFAHWRNGRLGALRMGLRHGAYCLGCCWFLMGLLFFGGIMNLYWIVGIAAFVLVEKTVPFGHWIGKWVGGALLLGSGAVALAAL